MLRIVRDQPSRAHQRAARRYDPFMCAVVAGILLWCGASWYVIIHFLVKFW